MTYEFQSIKKAVKDVLLKEKGSKFLGYLYPISSDQELSDALDELKTLHPKATHHCYAYRMGLNGEKYRANDDGEPSGSAGLPIYNQLLAHEITNVLLVVVRYYGGTKLGVSGLIKAYKESAKLTLGEAKIVTEELQTRLSLQFPFEEQNTAFTLLNKYKAKILDFQTSTSCKIEAQIATKEKENISEELSEMHLFEFKFLD